MKTLRNLCAYCGGDMQSLKNSKRFCSDKCRIYSKRGTPIKPITITPTMINEFTEERLVIYRFLDKMIDNNPLFIEKLRALCKSTNIPVTQSVNASYTASVENKHYEARTKTVNEYALERRELPQDDEAGYFKWLDRLENDQNLTVKQKSLAKSL